MRLRLGPLIGVVAGTMFLVYGFWLWHQAGDSSEVPILGGMASILMGGLILQRRPGNKVGGLLLALGLAACLQFAAEGYWTVYGSSPVPDLSAAIAVKFVAASGTLGFAGMLFFLPILFPDGRPHAAWSKWLLIGGSVFVAVQAVAFLVTGQSICIEETPAGRCLLLLERPPGLSWVPSPGDPPLENIFGPLILFSVVGGLGAAIARFRSSKGEARAQMKWFALAAVLSVLVIPPAIVINAAVGLSVPDAIFNIPFVLLPLAVGVAVLKHRLYEIDRIISRTVTYALVVGLLGLIVLGVVAGLAVFLPSDDPLVVAVATLVVFALFSPLRLRVQRVVDHRFNRSRYDAARVIDDFTGSLQDRVDPEGVVDDWVGVVEETMQPAAVGVWVRDRR